MFAAWTVCIIQLQDQRDDQPCLIYPRMPSLWLRSSSSSGSSGGSGWVRCGSSCRTGRTASAGAPAEGSG